MPHMSRPLFNARMSKNFVQREFRSRLWPMASTGEDCLSEEQSSLPQLPALNAPLDAPRNRPFSARGQGSSSRAQFRPALYAPPDDSRATRVGSRALVLVPRAVPPRP